jgi:hypothetical protein
VPFFGDPTIALGSALTQAQSDNRESIALKQAEMMGQGL